MDVEQPEGQRDDDALAAEEDRPAAMAGVDGREMELVVWLHVEGERGLQDLGNQHLKEHPQSFTHLLLDA
jgi:hypothetical protein